MQPMKIKTKSRNKNRNKSNSKFKNRKNLIKRNNKMMNIIKISIIKSRMYLKINNKINNLKLIDLKINNKINLKLINLKKIINKIISQIRIQKNL